MGLRNSKICPDSYQRLKDLKDCVSLLIMPLSSRSAARDLMNCSCSCSAARNLMNCSCSCSAARKKYQVKPLNKTFHFKLTSFEPVAAEISINYK